MQVLVNKQIDVSNEKQAEPTTPVQTQEKVKSTRGRKPAGLDQASK